MKLNGVKGKQGIVEKVADMFTSFLFIAKLNKNVLGTSEQIEEDLSLRSQSHLIL
jgi:hypothetical protein